MKTNSDKNIVLTGFMGCGKTSVGREVSSILRREFFDTDQIIEAREKKSISEIFANYGETIFREIEQAVVQSIGDKKKIVIATGGGTLLDENNLRVLSANGVIFCLMAEVDLLIKRLTESGDRPLLEDGSKIDNIKKLLDKRMSQYNKLPNHIDTSNLSIKETAEAVIRIFQDQPVARGRG